MNPLNGQTIAIIRQALAEGQITIDDVSYPVSKADVINELHTRHARRVAKGKGSTFPARKLLKELTGEEVPGTKTLAKAKPKAPTKPKVEPKAPAEGVDAKTLARYAKASSAQLNNWLRRADPNGPKAKAMQAELDSREAAPKAPAKTGSKLDAAKAALAALDPAEADELAAFYANQ